jgi:lipopolysaccharide/colanic/teichoic acid biosynthesis glycosyltransferase
MIKRAVDVVVSAAALIAFSPVLLAVALAVRLALGKPVLFVQERPGLHGVPFKLIKFRTMLEAYAPDGQPLPEEQRMTGLGGFLRSLSLDELPELWLVLKGDMSLVGPRPLLMEYLPRYSPEQARRHELRPGLTGWAQVNGRNNLSWEDKFRLDVWYVDHHSLWLDLKIIALTCWKTLKREGINQPGYATAPVFGGSGTQQGAAQGSAVNRP